MRPFRSTDAFRAVLVGAGWLLAAVPACGSDGGNAGTASGAASGADGGGAGGTTDRGAGGAAGDSGMARAGAGGSGQSSACRKNEIECDGECIDPDADADHCGGCDTECALDEVCSDGVCDVDCEPGRVVCERGCIDPSANEVFCGARDDCTGEAAGEACRTNERCQDGTCSSADALLADLGVFPGELAPAFASEQFSYSVTVPWYALRLVLTPEGSTGVASIAIGGVAVEPGGDYLVPQAQLDVKRQGSLDPALEIDVLGESGASNHYEIVHDRDAALVTQLKPSGTPEGEASGSRLAFSGDALVVAGKSGVELRRSESGSWIRRGIFPLVDAPTSVALDGDLAIAGTRGGEVHTFVRSGASFTTEAPLTTPAAKDGELFGSSVAVSGDTLAVGAPQDDGSPGSVYIYTRGTDAWEYRTSIPAPEEADALDSFGSNVALDGATLVVAALPGNDAVFVFTGAGVDWARQAILELVEPNADAAFFGDALAIDGDDVAVAATYRDTENNTAPHTGQVQVFHRSGASFAEQGLLAPSNGADGDRFGASVSIDSGLVAVGADAAGGGAAYLYGRRGTAWFELGVVEPAAVGAGDAFGRSVGFQSGILAVGAPGDDVDAPDSGGTWLFECTTCPGVD